MIHFEEEPKLNINIDEAMTNLKIPGVSIALIEDGKLVFSSSYGMANKKTHSPLDLTHRFQVASISKPLTAWGIMKLVQEGMIKLNDPIEKYLTRWRLPSSPFQHQDVTIKLLLNHTAGINGIRYWGRLPNKRLPSIEDSLLGKRLLLSKVRVSSLPSVQFLYTGGGYTMLQLLVEEVTGMEFAEYMKYHVLDPLKMMNSTFKWTPEINSSLPIPYSFLGRPLPQYCYVEQAAAGLYTTVCDLGRFACANLYPEDNTPRVLDNEYIQLMHNRVQRTVPYGLGFRITTLNRGERLIWHRGHNRGWCSLLAMIPEQKKGLIILINSDNGRRLIDQIQIEWLNSNIGKLTIQEQQLLDISHENSFSSRVLNYLLQRRW